MHHSGGGGGHGHGGQHGHQGGHHHAHGAQPSSSVSWNMAMQAEPFWTKIWRSNQKPMVITVGVVVLGVFWLYLIHFIHQKDDPNHVVSNQIWAQQLTSKDPRASQAATSAATDPTQQAAETEPAPLDFGSPGPVYEAAAPQASMRTYSNRPSLAPLMFSRFMPGYTPSSEGQTPLSAITSQTPNNSMVVPQQLMPTRVHSAERYKVVISR